MLEIEKIKNFVEAHSDAMLYQVGPGGGWAYNVTCQIEETDDKNNPKLTVYEDLDGTSSVLFIVYEKNFKKPSKQRLAKYQANYEHSWNEIICHHWRISKTPKYGNEQLIISYLQVDDYMLTLELLANAR